jgi:hypothetical protein
VRLLVGTLWTDGWSRGGVGKLIFDEIEKLRKAGTMNVAVNFTIAALLFIHVTLARDIFQ